MALGAFGVGVALAAIFRADPVDGFPVGTPLGPPTGITTMGLLHFVVSALAFTCFGVSALLAARLLARRGERAMSRLSLASGLVMLLGFFGGFALPSPVRGHLDQRGDGLGVAGGPVAAPLSGVAEPELRAGVVIAANRSQG